VAIVENAIGYFTDNKTRCIVSHNGQVHRSESGKESGMKETKPTGFGRYTKEEFVRRVRSGLNWHEEVRQVDLKRIREKAASSTLEPDQPPAHLQVKK
jgi:hypothetical protein